MAFGSARGSTTYASTSAFGASAQLMKHEQKRPERLESMLVVSCEMAKRQGFVAQTREHVTGFFLPRGSGAFASCSCRQSSALPHLQPTGSVSAIVAG